MTAAGLSVWGASLVRDPEQPTLFDAATYWGFVAAGLGSAQFASFTMRGPAVRFPSFTALGPPRDPLIRAVLLRVVLPAVVLTLLLGPCAAGSVL